MSREPEYMIEGAAIVQDCPMCSKKYHDDNIAILEENDGSHLVHVTCGHCAHAIMAIITVSQMGMSSVGIITDLDAETMERVRQIGAIGEEQVLSLHSWVQKKFTKPTVTFEEAILKGVAA